MLHPLCGPVLRRPWLISQLRGSPLLLSSPLKDNEETGNTPVSNWSSFKGALYTGPADSLNRQLGVGYLVPLRKLQAASDSCVAISHEQLVSNPKEPCTGMDGIYLSFEGAGSMYSYIIYFGLKVPSIWVLWGLSILYMGTWTRWVVSTGI